MQGFDRPHQLARNTQSGHHRSKWQPGTYLLEVYFDYVFVVVLMLAAFLAVVVVLVFYLMLVLLLNLLLVSMVVLTLSFCS